MFVALCLTLAVRGAPQDLGINGLLQKDATSAPFPVDQPLVLNWHLQVTPLSP